MTDTLSPELRKAAEQPPLVTDEYVFFFGYEGPQPEVCFQQWYRSSITESSSADKGARTLSFPTSEHYMMYHKALLMGDADVANKVLEAKHPSEAKAMGRQVTNFRQEVWDRECDGVVVTGNYLKFSQNEGLRGVLLGTWDREIVETSPNDRFWGIGFDTRSALENKDKWGENRLGKALMKVRDMLKEERSMHGER